jgi:hypothetical protein
MIHHVKLQSQKMAQTFVVVGLRRRQIGRWRILAPPAATDVAGAVEAGQDEEEDDDDDGRDHEGDDGGVAQLKRQAKIVAQRFLRLWVGWTIVVGTYVVIVNC